MVSTTMTHLVDETENQFSLPACVGRGGHTVHIRAVVQTMRTLGRNMAFLMKSIQIGKQQIGLTAVALVYLFREKAIELFTISICIAILFCIAFRSS